VKVDCLLPGEFNSLVVLHDVHGNNFKRHSLQQSQQAALLKRECYTVSRTVRNFPSVGWVCGL